MKPKPMGVEEERKPTMRDAAEKTLKWMNINDSIVVTLTAAGEHAWSRYWKTTEFVVSPSIRRSATLPDGRVRFQLWEAMHIFGPDCFNGSNRLPFVNNIVEIE